MLASPAGSGGRDALAECVGADQLADDVRAAVPRQRHTPIDGAPYRRQVRAALRSLDRMSGSQAYWHVSSVATEVGTIASQARSFIEGGDGRSALAILDAVTDEYVHASQSLAFSFDELARVALNGFESCFLPYEERMHLVARAHAEIALLRKAVA